MKRQIGITCALLLAMAAAASAQNDWTWHKAMPAGKTLEIKNISGDITATPTTGSEVEVVAKRHGSAQNIEIKVEETTQGITICPIYEGGSDCDEMSGSHHRRSWRDGEDVDFEVKVPSAILFAGHSISGTVSATNLTSDVDAGTVSGDIQVSTKGVAHASSVSGSVRARMGSNDWEDLSFSTVSGDVVLELPDNLDANVRFSTVSGDFNSDWPMTLTTTRVNRYGPRGGVRGTIGKGGRDLQVSTVSGSLELRKAR